MENKLFVGNLPWAATESDIRAHFSQAGEVTSVEVMMDKFTGRPRGFAFVTFASEAESKTAIEKMNGADLDGRALTVNEARPKESSGGGGGGGGGGGRTYSSPDRKAGAFQARGERRY